jgi:hypothetical protein
MSEDRRPSGDAGGGRGGTGTGIGTGQGTGSATDAGSEAVLGRGWRFPVRVDGRGRVALSTGAADVEEAIRVILGTARGERVMRPEFGCDLHEFAFATVDAATLTLVESAVREAIARWEPRVEVRDVEVSTAELDAGRLLVGVDYRVRSSDAAGSLVYPFYLEG